MGRIARIKNAVKKNKVLVAVSVAAVASSAFAEGAGSATYGIDYTAISTAGIGVIVAAGAAGTALMVSGNGLKMAVKWAKRMVGMS